MSWVCSLHTAPVTASVHRWRCLGCEGGGARILNSRWRACGSARILSLVRRGSTPRSCRLYGGVWIVVPPDPEDAKLATEQLILTKQTNREKDYVAIGELARLLEEPLSALRHSRSARDILEIAARHPELLVAAQKERPCLVEVGEGREALAAALDAERRGLTALNEERLTCYEDAARDWAAAWPMLQREVEALPLCEAHARMVSKATGCLPTTVPGA